MRGTAGIPTLPMPWNLHILEENTTNWGGGHWQTNRQIHRPTETKRYPPTCSNQEQFTITIYSSALDAHEKLVMDSTENRNITSVKVYYRTSCHLWQPSSVPQRWKSGSQHHQQNMERHLELESDQRRCKASLGTNLWRQKPKQWTTHSERYTRIYK